MMKTGGIVLIDFPLPENASIWSRLAAHTIDAFIYSTTATTDFCAVMDMACKTFRVYDPLFAEQCFNAARKAWDFLKNHEKIIPPGGYRDPPCIIGTGGYGDNEDKDERLWAAAEMYCITGENKYKTFFENNYTLWSPTINYPHGWLDAHNNGLFTYVLSTLNCNVNIIRDKIKKDIPEYSDRIVNKSFSTGYAITLNILRNARKIFGNC